MAHINSSHKDYPPYKSPELFEGLGSGEQTVDASTLRYLQQSAEAWTDDFDILSDGINGSRIEAYSGYNKQLVEKKMYPLAAHLGINFAEYIHESELEHSLSFIDFAFDTYEGRYDEVSDLYDAGLAEVDIIVPSESRLSGDVLDNGKMVAALPILKYIPSYLRSQFMLGIPPSLIGINRSFSGNKIQLDVLCPVYNDMLTDVSGDAAARLIDEIVNDTIIFCSEKLKIKHSLIHSIKDLSVGHEGSDKFTKVKFIDKYINSL